MNVLEFYQRKQAGDQISMITCYDFTSAKIVNQSEVDCILVGDSLAMVMHGFDSTLPATIEMMRLHTAAVVRGAPNKFVIGDMPFLSYRKGMPYAMDCVQQLMCAGAQAVKLEGVQGNLELIKHIVESGVPVMGHIGLTPQSIHQLGGFKVQGKNEASANALLEGALQLQEAGCFAIVLECVPSTLATKITQALDIATIGIGAGKSVDGQVLVFHDMLGMNDGFTPKFLKQFMSGSQDLLTAMNLYDEQVKSQAFPAAQHSYE